MILYVDGPSFLNITEVLERVADGFEDDRTTVWYDSDLDRYLPRVLRSVDDHVIHLMTGAWVRDHVYYRMVTRSRVGRPPDWFLNEWLLGRPTLGRGGRVIIVPNEVPEAADLGLARYEGVASPAYEVTTLSEYGERWGYTLLDLDVDDPDDVLPAIRRLAMINLHTVPSTDYMGPLRPTLTFVGESVIDYPYTYRPFLDQVSADYFRPYGPRAITHFGYATIEAYESLPPRLRRRSVAVGLRARHCFGDLPAVPDVRDWATDRTAREFEQAVSRAARYYELGGRDDHRH